MEDRLLKLDKYFEAGTSKKHQRSESMINGSSGALNMKMTTRIKSVEDRPKNISHNKRARTSLAEFQAEYQINVPKKQQPVTMAKDVNSLKDNGENSHQFEKNHRLDAIEEDWDKKMKRKRSLGTILSKPNDTDNFIPKRAIQNRVVNEQQHERVNNRKPSSSQWVGQSQRPQKRRSNLVSEDVSSSSPSNETPRSSTNGSLKITVKLDNLQFGLQESVGGERRTKGKMGNNNVQDISKKNKSVVNEESVLKQGHTARGLMIKKCNMSPKGKELDNSVKTKKNGSKTGRRLKRLSEYKGISDYAPLQNSSPPDFTAKLGDQTCSSPILKKKEPTFAPITSEEKFLLSQQLGFDALPSEKRKTHTPRQQPESFSNHKASPFYERVLSALIMEDDDDIDELLETDLRNIHIKNSSFVSTSDTYHHLNDTDPRKKPKVGNNSSLGQSLGLTKKSFTSYEDVNSEGSEYEEMCVDDRLLLELQYIGLCLDSMPGLEDNEDEYIPNEVDNLQTPLHQRDTKRRVPNVAKEVVKCHKSDKNCFNEYSLRDILSAPIENKQEEYDPKILSDVAFAVNPQTSNRGKSKKQLLNNAGPTISNGTKKKRSKRSPTKPPRAPRQKTEGKSVNKPTEQPPQNPVNETSQSVNNTRDVRFVSHEGNDDTTPLPTVVEDIDPMDELGAVGGPHDLDSLLSFNEEEDLEEDFEAGLAVPDDDLFSIF